MPLNPPARSGRKRAVAAVLALGLAIAPAAHAADAVEVLAVTASSTDGMLMDAVDGDAATGWRNKREGEKEAWLAVRFAEPTRLRGVRLLSGPMSTEVRVDIEGSIDGDRYETLLRDQRVGSGRPLELTFAGKPQALYLRLRFHHVGGGRAPQYHLQELVVLPAD